MRETTITGQLSLQVEEDLREWERLINESPYADTYYRPGYVRAYQDEGNKICGLLLHSRSRRYLLPLIYRSLYDLPFARDASGFDVVTPYGYGGILPLEGGAISREDGAEIIEGLQAWCQATGVVSCFVRLHSLEHQHQWFEGLNLSGAELHYSGATKSIELQEWDEEQAVPSALLKGRREKTRWARRKLTVDVCSCDNPRSRAALQEFMEIYKGTMDRRQASDFYYFSDTYYQKLAEGLGPNMAIAVARYQGHPVASSIFFADVRYAHYHLSGATDEGRRLHATAVVILKGAEWARERGCVRLHLGGGLRPNDSLFQFKETFGGRTFQFYSLRIIGDESRYTELVRRRLATGEAPLNADFFPTYRG